MIRIEIVNEKTEYTLIENVNIKDKEYENEYIVTIPSFTEIKNKQYYSNIYDISMIDSDIDNEGYEFVYENDKAIMVKADKKSMEQVIYNLVSNAVNYTGDDKKIYINLTEKKNIQAIPI